MKTGTKAQKAKHEKLVEAKGLAMRAVYSFAPNNQTPFNDCYALALPDARQAYHSATDALVKFEHAMVQEARGWFRGFVFNWY